MCRKPSAGWYFGHAPVPRPLQIVNPICYQPQLLCGWSSEAEQHSTWFVLEDFQQVVAHAYDSRPVSASAVQALAAVRLSTALHAT